LFVWENIGKLEISGDNLEFFFCLLDKSEIPFQQQPLQPNQTVHVQVISNTSDRRL